MRKTKLKLLEQGVLVFKTAATSKSAKGTYGALRRHLEEYGKQLRPGQTVRLLYTLGKPGGRAWDLPETLDSRTINIPRYKKLLIRAVEIVIQQIGTLSIPNLTLDDLLELRYQNPQPLGDGDPTGKPIS